MKKAIFLLLLSLHIGFLKADWVPVNNGLTYLNVNGITATGNYLFVSTRLNSYGAVFVSTNFGDSWTLTSPLIPVGALSSSGNHICCTIWDGLMFSTNYGQNWNNSDLHSSAIGLLQIGNIVYGACADLIPNSTNKGVWLSTNYGENWTSIGLNNVNLSSVTITGSHLFVTGETQTYVTTNEGLNWQYTFSGMVALASNGNYVFGGKNGSPYGVFMTTNYGSNWFQTPLNNYGVNSLAVYGNSIIAGSPYGVFLSNNNGANWQQRNEGLSAYVNNVYVTNNYVYAATDGYGLFRRQLSELVGIEKISESAPHEFSMDQNYPNPFNPTTNSKFSLPKSAAVKLVVYDILGKEVTTLINESLKPGSYEASFDGSNVASGLYFYKLEADNFVDTKRMILTK